MRTSEITIRGINRNIGSADNDTGFCSELINLKVQDGVKVVGEREIVSASIPYEDVKLHKIEGSINYIGVQNDADGVKIVHFNPESGKVIQTIDKFAAGSQIYCATMNNMLTISDKTSVLNRVYTFNDDKYTLLIDNSSLETEISITHELDIVENSNTDSFNLKIGENLNVSADDELENLQTMNSAVIKHFNTQKTHVFGYYLIGVNITLWDGTETRLSNLRPFFPTGMPYDNDSNTFDFPLQYVANDGNYYIKFGGLAKTHKYTIEANDLSDYSNVIKSVNVYISNPIMPISFKEGEITLTPSFTYYTEAKYNMIRLQESGLEKQLLYKYKSYSVAELTNPVEEQIEFGLESLPVNKTLEVDAGLITRAGQMFPFNNRIHFFNSIAKVSLDNAYYVKGLAENGAEYTCDMIVYLRNSNGEDIRLRYSDLKFYSTTTLEPYYTLLDYMIIIQDSRAYKVVFVRESQYCEILLESSPAYNYSYCYFGNITFIEGDKYNNVTTNDTYNEPQDVNVTASGNPMVFPVEYSYRFNGNITAIVPSFNDITESQVGQYPLNVFTDNGIYALQQGDGNVLYSRIIPISDDNCTNNSIVNTKSGIVYSANDAIYLLKGKQSTKLSMLIEGDPDMYIQNNQSFIKCCGGELYDITPLLSQGFFKDYVKGVKMIYSSNTNELIVSNPNYNYSYVYDFIYNSWYKISGTFDNIKDGLVLTTVDKTQMEATPATGMITVPAIHQEASRTFASVCNADYDTEQTCAPGDTISLILNDSQIASATFSQTTYMPMIVAVLCEKIPYLEDTKGKIYSTNDLKGQVIKIFNVTTNQTLSSSTFTSSNEAAVIPNKAVGADVTVMITEYKIFGDIVQVDEFPFTYKYTESSSVVTMLNNITDQINNSQTCPVTAQTLNNNIIITSKIKGQQANDIELSASTTDKDYIYVQTNGTNLTGGQDISLQPNQYRKIINWTNEKKNGQTTVHLHTRPIHFEKQNAFKIIKRAALNCLANIAGEQNLSIYIYASNNLIDWKCIIASQRKNCKIAQIITNRHDKAYKYFIIMIGGVVQNNTQLSNIVMSIEDVVNKKLR